MAALSNIERRILALEAAAAQKVTKRENFYQRLQRERLELDPETEALWQAERDREKAEAARQKAEYEALPVAGKIAHKQAELEAFKAEWQSHQAETPPPGRLTYSWRHWHDENRYNIHCRSIELDIMELEGAAPELIALARDHAGEAYRASRPMPPIPTSAPTPETPRQTHQERVSTAVEVWAPSEPCLVRPRSRTQLARQDHDRQNRFSEYGGAGSEQRIKTEPDAC